MMNKEMYLDYAATTPVKKEVIQTITDVMNNIYGNPSSIHQVGIKAKQALENSKKIIAQSINCSPNEIIFTSSGCESNSLAIQGYLKKIHGKQIITTKLEHKSIELLCKDLYSYATEYVNIDRYGFVDLNNLEELCKKARNQSLDFLVSIQFANSEIGTVQNIKQISEIVHKYNGVFHTDATQIFPYQKIDVKELDIDMMSVSGHKIGTPKGVGFLYVKNGIELSSIIYGSQMNGIRGGTENVPYIVGLSQAISLLDYHNDYIQNIRNYIIDNIIMSFGDKCIINGSLQNRIPTNINVSFKELDGKSILLLLSEYGIYVSTGSACNNGTNNLSSTLLSVGVPKDYINGTIRISLPQKNFNFSDADYFIYQLENVISSLYRIRGER